VSCLGAIFVGGASSRMGGRPKGLLVGPDGLPLVVRLASLLSGVGVPCVLVGEHPAYAHLGLATVADAAAGAGPLGGLVAALERAGSGVLVALACDMPFVTPALLRALLAHPSPSPIVAACRPAEPASSPARPASPESPASPGGPRAQRPGPPLAGLEPFFARYDAPRVLPVATSRLARGALSLRGLLEEAGVERMVLPHGDTHLLDDWDSPGDMAARR
jgi:molybdopterin-guanine dinucleotide biosynthesis protein A